MTILVAYVSRPEGQAALDKGLEIARRRGERLVVVNAGHDGENDEGVLIDPFEVERIEKIFVEAGVNAEFKQFIRGRSVQEEIEDMVMSLRVSLLIIGLRNRSAVGKLLLGSVSRDLLLSVPCPVLAVKANDWM